MSLETIRISLHSTATFYVLANYELTRAERYPSPVTLLYIKLDMEEEEGDKTNIFKRRFVEFINSGVRSSDIPAYYETDFVLMLPATDLQGGTTAAQRLLENFDILKDFKEFSVAIGISTYLGGTPGSVKTMMENAKSALNETGEEGIHIYKQ